MNPSNISKKQIIDELWRRGVLVHRCHSVQREMYELFYRSADNSTLVWLLARQSGKSFLLAILALEQALRHKNSIIKVLTDTKIHMETIFIPIMNDLLQECPQDVKPTYNKKTYSYYFANGSQIQLAGCDNGNYERLRGQKAALCLVDEAGFCDNISEVITSVLIPTTTHTGGNIVLASTPPVDYDHEFIGFIEEAEMKGLLTKKTIYDNPLLSKEQVERLAESMGGVHSERFRREYLCELIKDANRSVVPEATKELMTEIVKEWPRPPFFDSYVSMDLGFDDLTVVLFGYYDFRAAKVIIEDELVMQGKEKDFSIKNLTINIEKKEHDLWYNPLTNELKPPYLRVSDINKIVTNEISKNSDYRVIFQLAQKDDNEAAINNVRAMLGSKKIIIHPRCKTLIRHLENAKYKSKSNKKELARSPDDGHYDAFDALKYFLRHVILTKNPYPASHGLDRTGYYNQILDSRAATHAQVYGSDDKTHIYQKIFNRKRM